MRMSVDSQDFNQSASVMLCYRISLSITVCNAGGASLSIRQALELVTILFARGGKPKWITNKLVNIVVKAEQIYSSSSERYP